MNKLYQNKDWLYQKYITEKSSIFEIAKETKYNYNAIFYWLRKLDIPRRTYSEAQKLRLQQKQITMKGENNPSWKGGKHTSSQGYVSIHKPYHPHARSGGYIFEHRLVMEEHLGRYLLPHEIVHHIDGNRQNNNIKNLFLTTNKKHKSRYVDGYKEGFARGFLISYLASRYKAPL